ncbi:MAG: hypothetical protein Q9186_000007 [Xanthomendoza sp. 1 TL-2023]
MTPDWTWKTRGSIESFTKYNHAGSGCASLRSMSIRKFLANTFNVTPEILEPLPLHLKRQLWLEIKKGELDSLRNWKVFAATLTNEGIKSKRLKLPHSSPSLDECIRHVTSPSFTWITFLTLANLSCTRTELIQVFRLTNLGMLTIDTSDQSGSGLEDSIVRAWGRAASEAGAFTKFRILVCRSQSGITGKSFTYIQDFPALDMVLLDDCCYGLAEFVNQAEKYGWQAVGKGQLRPEAASVRSFAWRAIYQNLSEKGALFNVCPLDDSYKGNSHHPVLDIVLGASAGHPPRIGLYSNDLWLLHRKSRCNGGRHFPAVQNKKRPLEQVPEAGILSSKKRVIRDSRRQNLNDLWADFQA